MGMFQKNDTAHLEAMKKMKTQMTSPDFLMRGSQKKKSYLMLNQIYKKQSL